MTWKQALNRILENAERLRSGTPEGSCCSDRKLLLMLDYSSGE